MSDHAAFLRAICADPEDDTPRLVYADFLEESGEPANVARAGFIRFQIERTKDPEYNAFGLWPRLGTWEEGVLDRYGEAWASSLPTPLPGNSKVRFYWRRGFITAIMTREFPRLKAARGLWQVAPVEGIGVVNVNDDLARELAEWPALVNVRDLDLVTGLIGPAGARALADCPHLTGLRQLNLSSNRIGADGAWALATSENLPDLRSLIIWDASEEVARVFAESPGLERLEHLDLSCSTISAEVRAALTARFGKRVLL